MSELRVISILDRINFPMKSYTFKESTLLPYFLRIASSREIDTASKFLLFSDGTLVVTLSDKSPFARFTFAQ